MIVIRRSKSSRLTNLLPLFDRAIRRRETVLPVPVLHSYVDSILARSEVLLESAIHFGTPQYFFDEPSLVARIIQFRAAFSKHLPRFRVFYALKSNSFAGICQRIVQEGMGLDVSSGLELSMALSAGCREIVFSGPGKTLEELKLALDHRQDVTLLLDSFGEFQRIIELLRYERGQNKPIKAGIRIHRGGGWNKFGIPLRDLRKMLKMAHSVKGIDLWGIQFHTSWNLDTAPQTAMIQEISDYLKRNVPLSLKRHIQFLDIGGGFWPDQGEWLNPQNTLKGQLLKLLIPGTALGKKHYYHAASPIDHFAGEISRTISRLGPPLRNAEIWMEPGRWLSTPAMHVLLKVVDKKDNRTVITDGGTNLLGWERPLTEFIPVLNLTKPSHEEHPVKVFGSLCTPHDIWGTSFFGSGIDPGDILLIPDQGAYTYSLRQSFIKPKGRVIGYNGEALMKMEPEETWPPFSSANILSG